MPAYSAGYLNSIDPVGKLIYAAGGPGHRALDNAVNVFGQLPNWQKPGWGWWPLVGADAIETALLLAYYLFSGPQIAAIATAAGWYDALTGGAMVGNNYGPLLLTPPGNLDPRVAGYLNENSANLSYAVVLGGQAALPAGRVPQIGANIGVPDRYRYEEVTPAGATAGVRIGTAIRGTQGSAEQLTAAAAARLAGSRLKGTPPPGAHGIQKKGWRG